MNDKVNKSVSFEEDKKKQDRTQVKDRKKRDANDEEDSDSEMIDRKK